MVADANCVNHGDSHAKRGLLEPLKTKPEIVCACRSRSRKSAKVKKGFPDGKQPVDGAGPRAFYRKARRRVSRSGPLQLPPSKSLPFERAAGTTHETLARPSLFSRSAMEQFNSPKPGAAFRSRSQRKERHGARARGLAQSRPFGRLSAARATPYCARMSSSVTTPLSWCTLARLTTGSRSSWLAPIRSKAICSG